MTKAIVLFFCACVLQAATTARVIGANSTQMLVSVTTTHTGNCTYELSESPTYLPLVNDLNTAMFAGANSDARDGSLIYGSTHLMLIGRRTSAISAADGKMRSRALAAVTAHYGRATCGAETATFVASTANIPAGQSYPDLPPYSASGAGNYAWPQFNWLDRNEWVIEPITGLKVKRVSGPGDIGNTVESKAWIYALDRDGAWNSATSAVGWTGTGTPSAYADTATTSALFVGLNSTSITTSGNPFSGIAPTYSIDDVLPLVYGRGTDATDTNRQIDVCWSVDSGQTCETPAIRFQLGTSNAAGTSAASALFPGPALSAVPFSAAGGNIEMEKIGPHTGTLTASGATITAVGTESGGTVTGANRFQTHWTAGTKIFIATSTCPGNICEIASVTNAKTAVLTADPGITGTQAWRSANFGLRIVKTNATGSVYVAAAWSVATSRHGKMMGDNGSHPVCGPVDTTTVDKNGNALGYSLRGWPCIIGATSAQNSLNSALYFITEEGEVRYISPLFHAAFGSGADAVAANRGMGAAGFGWDSDPKTFYCQTTVSPYVVLKATYSSDWRQLPSGIAYSSTARTDSIAWSLVTKISESEDVLTAVTAYAAGQSGNLFQNGWQNFGATRGVGVAGGHYIGFMWEGQDLPCVVYSISLATGQMVKALDSISGAAGIPSGMTEKARWGACHETRAVAHGNKVMVQMNGAQGIYAAAVSQIDKGAGWTSTTTIAHSDAMSCVGLGIAAQWVALGATGTNCLKLRLGSDPARTSPKAAELTPYPCSHDAAKSCPSQWAEGDQLVGGTSFTTERMRVVKITRNSNTDIEVVVQRRVFCGSVYGGSTDSYSNGWTAYAANNHGCRGSVWWFEYDNATSGWYVDTGRIRAGHMDYAPDGVGGISQVTGGYSDLFGLAGLSVRRDSTSAPDYAQEPDFIIPSETPFASATGTYGNSQSYPSKRQTEASTADKRWTLDYYATNASLGAGDENPSGPHATFVVAQSAVGGMSNVYRITVSEWTMDRKRQPLIGWSGRYLWRDISGPSSSMTNGDTYTYCVAEVANECVAGSSAGYIYINVPYAVTNGCYSGTIQSNYPCLLPQPGFANWGVQIGEVQKPAFKPIRKLTMSFGGPGYHYQYTNWRPLPGGTLALMRGTYLDGIRSDVLLAKLPPWPPDDNINRTTWVPLRITLPARPGAVVVKFGYLEHGTATQYYCTTRQESCLVNSATISESSPFEWQYRVTTQAVSGLTCTSGCTVAIPTVSGRVVYYEAYDVAAGVLTAISGAKGVSVVP